MKAFSLQIEGITVNHIAAASIQHETINVLMFNVVKVQRINIQLVKRFTLIKKKQQQKTTINAKKKNNKQHGH